MGELTDEAAGDGQKGERLDQPLGLEAEITALSYYDVIQDRDAEDGPGITQPLGRFHVVLAGRNVSAGVIMTYYYSRCICEDRRLKDFSWMDYRCV